MQDTVDNNNICAIATAPGPSAISIVRLSGPNSLVIADRLFSGLKIPPSQRPGNNFFYGDLNHPESGEIIDGVITLVYRSPHSYTGENSVEFNGHGGSINAGRILDAVCAAGARIGEPGEFTRRAVANGKIDLLQAESILELINAGSIKAAQVATRQIEGSLSHEIVKLYDSICYILAELENYLDIDDSQLYPETTRDLRNKLRYPVRQTIKLLKSWYAGRVLHEDARVVLSGLPNTGKSSLFNLLLDQPRAIVTSIPGTTRDTIEETVLINGFPVRLIDTAGLRPSDCIIERHGMARTMAAMQNAALNIRVIDATQPLSPETIRELQKSDQRCTLVVINKIDRAMDDSMELLKIYHPLYCSAKTGKGINKLKQLIFNGLHISLGEKTEYAITTPQKKLLQMVIESLLSARNFLLANNSDLVLAAHEIRTPLAKLGSLLGRQYSEDMYDAIFSRFCVGK